jgi:hypothetical protein
VNQAAFFTRRREGAKEGKREKDWLRRTWFQLSLE